MKDQLQINQLIRKLNWLVKLKLTAELNEEKKNRQGALPQVSGHCAAPLGRWSVDRAQCLWPIRDQPCQWRDKHLSTYLKLSSLIHDQSSFGMISK